MKKLLLLILIATCTIGVQAQIASSSSSSLTTTTVEKEKNKISYVRAGLNMSTFSKLDELDDVDTKRKSGYSVMYGFNKELSLSGVYWGMEFGLSSRGYVLEYDGYYDEDFTRIEQSLWAHSVQVSPFNIGYKYEVVNNLKVDIHLGTYISYDYTGSGWLKDKDNSNEKGNTLENYGLSDVDDYNSFDAGLTYGFGIWFKDRLNLDFFFQNGLIEPLSDSGNTRNFILRLGVAF